MRYTPANQQGHFNSGASTRLIRLVEAQVDPLEPPKFRHKKVPRGPPSPPPPVMHSPPRKLSQKDVADWKIPPCISNWKNPKGYTIPLDKRMAADGRGLQQIQINDNFAKLSESLFIAERNARDAVSHRNRIRETLARNKIQQKEDLLRQIAEQTREERSQALEAVRSSSTSPSRRSESPESHSPAESHPDEEDNRSPEANDDRSLSAKEKRDMIRKERERERERERRMEAMGRKTKAMRDAERDISEKVALGEKAPPTRKETQYDSRLFSQNEGMDSGFGAEDDYNLYEKPLLRGSNANTLYRPKVGDSDVYGNAKDVDKLLDTKKFKPSRDFDGVDRSDSTHSRSGPVQFERANQSGHTAEEDDPFGLDEFISEAKSKSLDHIGHRGTLHAGASGGSATDTLESTGKRSRLQFEKETDERSERETKRRRRRDDD